MTAHCMRKRKRKPSSPHMYKPMLPVAVATAASMEETRLLDHPTSCVQRGPAGSRAERELFFSRRFARDGTRRTMPPNHFSHNGNFSRECEHFDTPHHPVRIECIEVSTLEAEQGDDKRFVSLLLDHEFGRYVARIMGRAVVGNLWLGLIKLVFLVKVLFVCVAV